MHCCARSMIGDLAGDDEDMMATAYRHPSMWYNPKLTGPRSKLLERTFRLVKVGKAGRVIKDDVSVDGDGETKKESKEGSAEEVGSGRVRAPCGVWAEGPSPLFAGQEGRGLRV